MPKLESRTVSLFKNGRNQALRIPKDFEFDTREAVITRSKDGKSLTVTPVRYKTFGDLFKEWEAEGLNDEELEFPEIEDLPPKDIDPFKDFDPSDD